MSESGRLICDETEADLLSALLIDPDRLSDLSLAVGDFRLETHRHIFTALENAARNGGADFENILTYLDASGQLSNVGGAAGLTRFYSAPVMTVAAPALADEVRGAATRRRLKIYAEALLKAALHGDPAEVDPGPLLEITRPRTRQAPGGWSMSDLLLTDFPEPRWTVPGLLPIGLTILAGRPKQGKSFLALQIAHAVGSGGRVFGIEALKSPCVCICLEDSPRRIKERLSLQGAAPDADVRFYTTWRPLLKGGQKDIEALIVDGARLVVVDTFARIKGIQNGRYSQQEDDLITAMLGDLQSLALRYDATILLVDHHRKPLGGNESAIDDILGATAKSAVADAVFGLYRQRGGHETTLKIVGREIEQRDLALVFDRVTGCWQYVGETGAVREDSAKARVLEAIQALEGDGTLPTTKEISRFMDVDPGYTSKLLGDLVAAGQVERGSKVGAMVPYRLRDRNDG